MRPTDLVVGEFVLLAQNSVLGGWHAVGRVAAAPGLLDQTVWVDYNGGGVHLPQMYRWEEMDVLDIRPEALAHHGFCEACKGFGVDSSEVFDGSLQTIMADRAFCEACGGTGVTSIKITARSRSTSLSFIQFSVDEEAVKAIACETCRAARTPTVKDA